MKSSWLCAPADCIARSWLWFDIYLILYTVCILFTSWIQTFWQNCHPFGTELVVWKFKCMFGIWQQTNIMPAGENLHTTLLWVSLNSSGISFVLWLLLWCLYVPIINITNLWKVFRSQIFSALISYHLSLTIPTAYGLPTQRQHQNLKMML